MSVVQSKLMLQLAKEQRSHQVSSFQEEILEDIYNTICKLDPKNLMLVEYLMLVIEKDFIRNSNKLTFFMEMFDDVRGYQPPLDPNALPKSGIELDENKFSRKKFIKLLK